jgi:hypothetical protein
VLWSDWPTTFHTGCPRNLTAFKPHFVSEECSSETSVSVRDYALPQPMRRPFLVILVSTGHFLRLGNPAWSRLPKRWLMSLLLSAASLETHQANVSCWLLQHFAINKSLAPPCHILLSASLFSLTSVKNGLCTPRWSTVGFSFFFFFPPRLKEKWLTDCLSSYMFRLFPYALSIVQNKQRLACCFVWVWNLVAHSEGGI